MLMSPLFTIAVTTYNRKDMLKECLASISQQGFTDYEVIIGNNYTEEALTREALGISDPRVRIVNHPDDLGQLGNMNYLLHRARGRYFTWLADDDLLTPQCLEALNQALNQFSYPRCVFCLYDDGAEYVPVPAADVSTRSRVMNGSVFLQRYLSRKLKLIGCYGGLETEYLREIGGIQKLGNGFSPYADNLIAIQAGLLDKVAYIDVPLFFFRTHDQSLSYTSSNLTAYASAQQELLSICEGIFMREDISSNYRFNMYYLLKWLAGDIYSVSSRSASLLPDVALSQLKVLEHHARKTGWFYTKYFLLNLRLIASHIRNVKFQKRTAA